MAPTLGPLQNNMRWSGELFFCMVHGSYRLYYVHVLITLETIDKPYYEVSMIRHITLLHYKWITSLIFIVASLIYPKIIFPSACQSFSCDLVLHVHQYCIILTSSLPHKNFQKYVIIFCVVFTSCDIVFVSFLHLLCHLVWSSVVCVMCLH